MLMGFPERDFAETRTRLRVDDGRLFSDANSASYGVGVFSLPSLGDLRRESALKPIPVGRLSVSSISGDVRSLHRAVENDGALFQVASQFNMLEMISPQMTPEHGVGIYGRDPTQGPACAIAAGAATIFRNYFVPNGDGTGQTSERQIDGSAGLAAALSSLTGVSRGQLWTMRNGYALFSEDNLAAIDDYLADADEAARDALRATLVVGLHEDVEVTDRPVHPGQRVSQIFCSALPVAYNHEIRNSRLWCALATLVLEAAFEASLLAAARQAARGGSGVLLLTSLGGGAFGNNEEWIIHAMRRALSLACDWPLDVKIVSYHRPSRALVGLVNEFER